MLHWQLRTIEQVIELQNCMYHCCCSFVTYNSLIHGSWMGVHSHNSPSLNHRAATNANSQLNKNHIILGNIYIHHKFSNSSKMMPNCIPFTTFPACNIWFIRHFQKIGITVPYAITTSIMISPQADGLRQLLRDEG